MTVFFIVSLYSFLLENYSKKKDEQLFDN